MRAFACALLLGLAVSADARPNAARDVLGCWDVSTPDLNARITLSSRGGGTGRIRVVSTFRTRTGTSRFDEEAVAIGTTGELEVLCRPRSQHGSFCRIQPEAGELRVRVYAKRYRDRNKGHLVEQFVAGRCG